jgi:hypothetical protein
MKHFKTRFRGEKPLHEIHEAVGREGGLVERVHVEGGETTVFFSGGDGKGEHLRRLGAESVESAREEEVTKFG